MTVGWRNRQEGADLHDEVRAAGIADSAADAEALPLLHGKLDQLALHVALVVRQDEIDDVFARPLRPDADVSAVPHPFFDHAARDQVTKRAADGRDIHLKLFRQHPFGWQPPAGTNIPASIASHR